MATITSQGILSLNKEELAHLGLKRGEKTKVVGRVEKGTLVISPLKKKQAQSHATV